MIRWNLLGKKIDESRQALQDIQNGLGKYANAPAAYYWKQTGEEIEIYNPAGSKSPLNIPQQTPSPTTGWTKVDWRTHLTSTAAIDSKPLWQAFASFFTPNKSELFPFDQGTIDAYQGQLKQNPNY